MTKIWDIFGGIHPPENKQQSLGQNIQAVPLPESLTLPLSQHIGAPAVPIVSVGDTVLKGQLIAAAKGFVSAPLHAPSSGTISAIETLPIAHASGMAAPCIVIKTDGEDRWIEHSGTGDYRSNSAKDLIAKIRDAGITGLGGAGFPSAVKLQARQTINTLIINATECEPYITADDQLIREYANDILVGIDVLSHVLGDPEHILIGIEDNKPEAQHALAAALENHKTLQTANTIQLVEFPTKYPSGGEKQLIQILTGQEVPSGKLPAELGIVCQNIGTTHAIYRAICHGEPLITRTTTVTGKACNKPGNFQALIGTPVEHLLAQGEFNDAACERLIMGGPMMGFVLPSTHVPIIKSTNCLLAASAEESPENAPAQACIRCGHCAEACPANLLPQQLYWHAQSKNYERLEAYHLPDCIECGACSYVCPSSIPLVQYYRAAKGEIRLIAAEKHQSDRARARFEYRQERIEQEEKEKAAKREARRLAAQAKKQAAEDALKASATEENKTESAASDASDIVKAAMARVSEKNASPDNQRQRFERAIKTSASRLQRAEQALKEFSSADKAKYDQQLATIEQARLRHEEAKAKLSALDTQQPQDLAEATTAKTSTRANEEENLDPASAAIARAQKNAALQADMSPQQKLEKQRQSLLKRLEKAQIRATQAKAENSDQLDAFNHALSTLNEKLKKTDEELAAFDTTLASPATSSPNADKAPEQDLDPAAAAIARAQKNAALQADMSPRQKLEKQRESLLKRLEKAQGRVTQAEADDSTDNNTDNNQLEIFKTALQTLEEKLKTINTTLRALDEPAIKASATLKNKPKTEESE